MVFLRALSRSAGILLMVVLALLGLGLALYCFDGLVSLGAGRPDRLLDLPSVRTHVGRFLNQVEAPGVTAGLALLCGLGAMLLGTLLLIGLLRSRRRRLAVLDGNGRDGRLAAKPGPLRDMARALAEQAPATAVKRPKIALSRRGHRGRMKVRATSARTSKPRDVEQALAESLHPISEPFRLTPRIRVRPGGQGERVR
jgi:hypothetical protein